MGGTKSRFGDGALWDQLELGPNTRSFLRRVYADGIDKYERRLRALGFAGGVRALDAGCGLGQWSFALAGICGEVWGVDASNERVGACDQIAKKIGKTNVRFLHGSIDHLPLVTASFDRALCYSVLNLTPYEKVIKELGRVMQPGGLVYVNANAIGRFVQDIVHQRNPAPDFNPRWYSALTLVNTLVRKRAGLSPQTGGLVLRRSRIERLLERAGFDIVASGPEGTLLGGTEPFLAPSYFGLASAFDVLARRRGER